MLFPSDPVAPADQPTPPAPAEEGAELYAAEVAALTDLEVDRVAAAVEAFSASKTSTVTRFLLALARVHDDPRHWGTLDTTAEGAALIRDFAKVYAEYEARTM